MIKRSIALAVLATLASGAALAQSSVTLYGRLNVTAERQKVGSDTQTVLEDNYSRIGFKGEEDLGGGLKAGFIIEHGFDPTTGAAASTFWGRQSEVYLSSKLGMLRLVNFIQESLYATADVVSMHNHNTGTSADALYAFVSNGANHLSYRTPTWNNLTVEIGTSLHEKTAEPAKNAWDLAATYERGDWSFGLGYGDWGPARQATLRATYALSESWTFSAYHQYNRGWDHANYVVDASQGGRHTTRLAAMYTEGPHEFHVNVGYAGKAGGVAGTQALQWTLAYNHNFSKRTKLYALFTRIDNRAQASYGTGTAGGDLRSFGVGLRQYF